MVIGHPRLDGGVSLLGQTFSMVVSKKCFLFKVNLQYFDKMIWAKTRDYTVDVRISILQ
tara:strand:- start:315 stop:491 length:177 start_codon:yes stop_codon:yes gene_type:complete